MRLTFIFVSLLALLACNNEDEAEINPRGAQGEGRYWVIVDQPPMNITYLNESGAEKDTLVQESSWKYIYTARIGDSASVKVRVGTPSDIYIDLHFSGGSYLRNNCIDSNLSDYCEAVGVVDWPSN
ncbi:MAG: hypothetical protein AB3N16_02635 [Flavobacteriaceae bacterium]